MPRGSLSLCKSAQNGAAVLKDLGLLCWKLESLNSFPKKRLHGGKPPLNWEELLFVEANSAVPLLLWYLKAEYCFNDIDCVDAVVGILNTDLTYLFTQRFLDTDSGYRCFCSNEQRSWANMRKRFEDWHACYKSNFLDWPWGLDLSSRPPDDNEDVILLLDRLVARWRQCDSTVLTRRSELGFGWDVDAPDFDMSFLDEARLSLMSRPSPEKEEVVYRYLNPGRPRW